MVVVSQPRGRLRLLSEGRLVNRVGPQVWVQAADVRRQPVEPWAASRSPAGLAELTAKAPNPPAAAGECPRREPCRQARRGQGL